MSSYVVYKPQYSCYLDALTCKLEFSFLLCWLCDAPYRCDLLVSLNGWFSFGFV